MHSLVCIKQVPDQGIPLRAFRVDRSAKRPHIPDAALVMSTFDSNALEVALKLREAIGAGSSVTALSLGAPTAEEVLRKALAVTADKAVLVSDPALGELDPSGLAVAVAAVVRRLAAEAEPIDLVLTGRQAGDWEHGQTGGMIAEALGWPCLTFVSRLRPANGGLEAWREVENGRQVITARPPLVATITNDATNQLRLSKVRDMMRAHRAPIATWGIAELGLDPSRLAPRMDVVDLVVPERDSHCELVEDGTSAERAAALARRLRELKVI